MLKTDTEEMIDIITSTLMNTAYEKYIRIHKMYKTTPVNPNWAIEKERVINDLHLLFVIKGKGTYTLGSETIPMKKGQLFIVSNNFPHSAHSDPTDLIHMFSMRFGIYSTNQQRFIPNYFGKPFGSVIMLREPHVCHALLNSAYQHFLEQGSTSSFAMDSLMRQVLLEICATSEPVDSSVHIDALTRNMLQKHGKNITITSMAKEMGLSTKQFTRLFHKHTHMTPHQYLIKTRINYAKYLLEETTMSIHDIALELDYADAFTFSRQFKKIVGASPTTFKSNAITH